MTPSALERLLARLANRRRVVFLSGDVHYSLSMKGAYWQFDANGDPRRDSAGDVIATRFIQLTSSAALKDEGEIPKMAAHLALAQQLGMVLSGPFERVVFRRPPLSPVVDGADDESLPPPIPGQWPEPWLTPPAGAKFSPVVYRRMTEDPAVITLGSLPEGTCTSVPALWSWRVELMKDERPDDVRLDGLAPPPMPSDVALRTDSRTSMREIADRQFWQGRHGITRSLWLSSNICTIRLRDTEISPGVLRRELVHTVWAHDPREKRSDAPRPYIEHVIPLDPQPDEEIPTLPRCP